jgi:hypothetical protein
VKLEVSSEVIEWRGPAPFYFLPISGDSADQIREAARLVSYGWGVVPVTAEIEDVSWQTSLMPRSGSYLLPLKDDIRRAAGIELGQSLTVVLRISA